VTSSATILGESLIFGTRNLHGLFLAPDEPALARVLIVSPLFEEKRIAHRALITCARALAQAGVAVFMPDLTGTGNSAGRLVQATLDGWLEDLREAVAVLTARTDAPLRIIGCRAGALLAARLVDDDLFADRLLLWQPVVSGKSYLGQLRTRRKIQDQMTGDAPPEVGACEIEGEELSPELYAQLEAVQLPDKLPHSTVCLVQCAFNEKLIAEYERLVTRWGAERVSVRYLIAEPFWHAHTPGAYAELAAALVKEVV